MPVPCSHGIITQHLGAKFLGEGDTGKNGALGLFGAIGRQQDTFEHAVSPEEKALRRALARIGEGVGYLVCGAPRERP